MIFRWSTMFRPFPNMRKTALAMVDPRPGDSILFAGADDPALAGECGAVAGLNGRAVVVDEKASAARAVEAAAGNAGALVEFTAAPLATLPFEAGTFGLIVVPDLARWPAEQRQTWLAEAFRVAQPGARIIVLVLQKRGLFSGGRTETLPKDQVLHMFTRLGAVAGRELASAEGVGYFEARKPR